ncbi:MAG: nicotinate-nucleotide adenylyltransferase [Pseudanabaena sp. ELA607]|jgi:nicotinate-nucleotide adenylyltransferase
MTQPPQFNPAASDANQRLQIALFGTSGDPPSVAHQTILRYLSQNYDLCVVWVADNPFKRHQASLAHRLTMMELTIADLAPDCANVGLYPEMSHRRTVHTLDQAAQVWPQAEFTLVVGIDLLPQLPTWYEAAQLLRRVKLLVMPRQGYHFDAEAVKTVTAMCSAVQFAPPHTWIPDVSSSEYRNGGNRSVIIASVAAYIEQEHLYEWQTASPAIP